MLRYLRWFSIAGVWYPIALFGAGFLLAACFTAVGWQSGAAFLYVVGVFLVFALAHACALAALIAAGLFLTRQANVSWFPLCTALIGALVSARVLGPVYRNFTLT